MDINQLEVFLAVAQERSFSRAAEALHRTQPAVSQAIRRLETELGESLFDRSSKDGTLTAAGRVLLDFSQQMLNLRQNAHSAIRELRDLHRGKLSLGANEYTVMSLLPLVPIFRARHPHVKIEVKRSLASRIPGEIIGRDVEIGVVSCKPNDPAIKSLAAGVVVREMKFERRLHLIYRKGASLSHAAKAFLRVARDQTRRSDS